MRLAERLRAGLDAPPPGEPMLAGDDTPFEDAVTDAAVLVPVVDRVEPSLILTQRSLHLRRHPGQIAFPGGRIDAGDADAVAAALREAEEEIALPARAVEVIGVADRYRTGTGFAVVPVVGVVPPDLPLVPAEAEVASIFEVPLAFVLDLANHAQKVGEFRGQRRHYHEIRWNDRIIWGATAGIIVNLARRLRWS